MILGDLRLRYPGGRRRPVVVDLRPATRLANLGGGRPPVVLGDATAALLRLRVVDGGAALVAEVEGDGRLERALRRRVRLLDVLQVYGRHGARVCNTRPPKGFF